MRLIENANDRGGRDNITVLVLDIRAIGRYPSNPEQDEHSLERTQPFLNTIVNSEPETPPSLQQDEPPRDPNAKNGSGRRAWFRGVR